MIEADYSINNIPTGSVMNDEESFYDNDVYEIPTATVVDNIQEIEMIDMNSEDNSISDLEQEHHPPQNLCRKKIKYCLRWILIFVILFGIILALLRKVIFIKNNKSYKNNNAPTTSPTYSLMPTSIPTTCDNTHCLLTLWESKKNDVKGIAGKGLNISFIGQEIFKNDSHKLNKYKPNLNNKVSVLELIGPSNCSVMFADSKLNPSQWIFCDLLYKCDTKYSGIYDLSKEAYSTNRRGKMTRSWNDRIGSVYIKPRLDC
tara:strand:- start:2284 stop:3060 length:777 start_codon:yes stop_codon:yes gene_type:complete